MSARSDRGDRGDEKGRVADFDHPDVVIHPHGPMLVRGATSIQDADGTVHQVHRPVVALCRCDKSSRLPWCDGTHKVIPKR